MILKIFILCYFPDYTYTFIYAVKPYFLLLKFFGIISPYEHYGKFIRPAWRQLFFLRNILFEDRFKNLIFNRFGYVIRKSFCQIALLGTYDRIRRKRDDRSTFKDIKPYHLI